MLCHMRFGILPIRVETGRYSGEPVEQRICRLCTSNLVEDEKHFLLDCSLYNNLRNSIFSEIVTLEEFKNLSDNNKLNTLINRHTRKCSKFVLQAYQFRRKTLFS